jgi:uncharacterized protein (TIGR03083 family)
VIDAVPADVAVPLEALRGECEALSGVVLGLEEARFDLPVPRTPAWTVKELLGHVHRGVARIGFALDHVVDRPPDVDSVSYWRSYDRVGDASDVAERGRAAAAPFPTGKALAGAWDQGWRETVDRASNGDGSAVVVTFGPSIRFAEYLKTRVVEVTVHRMDLEDALGHKGWGTDAAISIVDDILVGLLGAEPPRSLEWDAVDFIEAAAGRRDLTDAERKKLGLLASRFPLLG